MYHLYENLVDSMIREDTFEIKIENVNRCFLCTAHDSWFFTAYQP